MASQKGPSGRNVSAATPTALGEDERRLFEQEYAGVKPLAGPARVAGGVRPGPGTGTLKERLSGRSRPSEQATAPTEPGLVTWSAPGVQPKTAKALARGELGFDATCDLHGMTADLARHQLERVVEASVRVGRRTLLVIVGRGLHSGPEGPVLPALVMHALRSPPVNSHVLAFAPAAPAHGGQGALAVLLRRSGTGK